MTGNEAITSNISSQDFPRKFANADVMLVSVRHVPFREVEEILSCWDAAKMGYVFSICSENSWVQDYLQGKYLNE